MKNLHKHFWHYIVYLAIFGVGLFAVLSSRGNSGMQEELLVIIAFLYFLWAMIHHYVHHQLTSRVVVEYALIVFLGILLLGFLYGV